jgi:uncharacterized protein YhfF
LLLASQLLSDELLNQAEDTTMDQTSRAEAFWQTYLAALPGSQRLGPHPHNIGVFGDSKEMADELGHLVQSGTKTATSALVWELEADGEQPQKVGDKEVIVDGSGEPLCIFEITEVEIRPFDAIDETFAFDYGERDRSLAWWRRAMWGYYSEVCQKLGREPSESMPLACFCLRLLYAGAA